jgi:hypothetical protein
LNQSDGLAATSRTCREWKPFPQESPRRCRAAACRRLEILARVKNPAAKAMSISNAVPMRSMIWPSRFVDTGIQDTVGLLVPPALRLLCRWSAITGYSNVTPSGSFPRTKLLRHRHSQRP